MNTKLNIAIAGWTMLSSDEIKSDQDKNIRKPLVKVDQSIHDNAVQCMAHAAEHGDTSLMRRLLTDILGDTGYRTQGLIAWMRLHSPMELKAQNVDLSGFIMSEAQREQMIKTFPNVDPSRFVVGERRPFLIEEAHAAPFRTANYAKEVVKPLFQNTILSPISAAAKKFTSAVENTVNGQPLDPSKPFYDGKHMDAIAEFFDKVKALEAKLPADATSEIRARQARVKEDSAFLEAVQPEEGKVEEIEVVKAGEQAAA